MPPRLLRRFLTASLVAAALAAPAACASRIVREARYPIAEQPPVQIAPGVRGVEAAADAIPQSQQVEIIREVVRVFFRPRSGQARWIDPQPLAHRRARDADSLATPDPELAAAVVDATGLRRVCLLHGSDADCRGRPGGVLRFSAPYSAGPDSALVFARYTPVGRGGIPRAGPGFELEFHLVHRDGSWRIVNRRTITEPEETRRL